MCNTSTGVGGFGTRLGKFYSFLYYRSTDVNALSILIKGGINANMLFLASKITELYSIKDAIR